MRGGTTQVLLQNRNIELLLRSIVSFIGGAVISRLSGILLVNFMPLERFEATALSIMCSFIIFVFAALWLFASQSLIRSGAAVLLAFAFMCGLMFAGVLV